MHEFKRIIFSILMLTFCNCCDIVNYSVTCEEEQIDIMVSFEKAFDGTIFANGYNGDPNCSLPNMEASGSNIVVLSLPFMSCNTTLARVEGKDNLQALNIITIQFHPLIKSVLDCEIKITCDIDYLLPNEFFSSYLKRDLNLPIPIDTNLDIMSAEKLFGNEIADMLSVNQQYFLILNVSDGGKHDRLRIRKCYAHARRVIDKVTDPDILLEDNKCDGDGLINRLSLKAEKSHSDLRDFSAIQNLQVSFTQKPFYITCAFDLCTETCEYTCFGEMEIRNSQWSTVRTFQVDVFDKSFKGFRNRNMELRASIKNFSERFLKLKDRQISNKTAANSKRTPRFDTSGESINVSMVLEEETVKHSEEISTINVSEFSEVLAIANANQDVTGHIEKLIDRVNLNSSETVSEYFRKRSIVNEEAEDYDNNEDTTISDSLKITIITDMTDESNLHISATDCAISTCKSNEKARSILDLETIAINSISSKDSSSEFDEIMCNTSEKAPSIPDLENPSNIMSPKDNSSELDKLMDSSSDYSLTVSSNVNLPALYSINKDCVPYLKFTSVTASLSVLSVCLFLICLGVILFYRKERKRYTSQSKYLYQDF